MNLKCPPVHTPICLNIANQLLMLFRDVVEHWDMGPSLNTELVREKAADLKPSQFLSYFCKLRCEPATAISSHSTSCFYSSLIWWTVCPQTMTPSQPFSKLLLVRYIVITIRNVINSEYWYQEMYCYCGFLKSDLVC